ncbi:phage tailspike protein [Escherichia coli]
MSDITANVVVSMPSQLFTMARSFKAVANGKIYIGKIDTDPVNPENQIQVYVENEDGSHVPVSQPIIINAAGYPVYNGQIAKFVTVQGHSMAVYDAYGAQQFYFPNVLKYDPDQLRQELAGDDGYLLVPSVFTEANKQRWREEGDIRGWGAKCDGETDDSQAIRYAFSETNDIVIPKEKSVYIGSTIVTPRDFTITGKNSTLKGADDITILKLPQYNGVVTGTIISGLHFAGIGCTAIGVETPSVGGSGYYRYVPRLSVRDCHFYWELSYGIDGNLIFADIFNCSFGYLGTDGAPSGNLSSIRNRATDGETNNPNFNRIRKCYFYKGSGATTHINGYRGGQLSIEDCDFEQAGQCISLDGVGNINIERCWFESCNGLNGIIKITNCPTSATITKSKFYRCQGASDGATITYDSTNVAYLEVSKCNFEQQNNYPLYNSGVAGVGAIKVPPTNNVRWFDNTVVFADPASAYTTAYQYRGPGSVRAQVRFNMATSTIISSTVPVTLSKQGTGSMILNFTDRLGVNSTSALSIQVTAYNGYARFSDGGGSVNSQILVNTYQGGGVTIFDSTDVSVTIF